MTQYRQIIAAASINFTREWGYLWFWFKLKDNNSVSQVICGWNLSRTRRKTVWSRQRQGRWSTPFPEGYESWPNMERKPLHLNIILVQKCVLWTLKTLVKTKPLQHCYYLLTYLSSLLRFSLMSFERDFLVLEEHLHIYKQTDRQTDRASSSPGRQTA